MNKSWSSEAVHLESGVCFDTHATRGGVVLGCLVNEVLSIDAHMSAENAEKLGKALIEASTHSRAMREGE